MQINNETKQLRIIQQHTYKDEVATIYHCFQHLVELELQFPHNVAIVRMIYRRKYGLKIMTTPMHCNTIVTLY
jgi:hypothetical protein